MTFEEALTTLEDVHAGLTEEQRVEFTGSLEAAIRAFTEEPADVAELVARFKTKREKFAKKELDISYVYKNGKIEITESIPKKGKNNYAFTHDQLQSAVT